MKDLKHIHYYEDLLEQTANELVLQEKEPFQLEEYFYTPLTDPEVRKMYGRIREFCPVDYFSVYLPEQGSAVYGPTLKQMDLILFLYRDSEAAGTQLQEKMFKILGFTQERAEAQFGFLMNAFKYGAPPHAGLAFGLDRFVSILAGLDSIRDCIAFPKNNSGRDVMLDAPSELEPGQLDELHIKLDLKK